MDKNPPIIGKNNMEISLRDATGTNVMKRIAAPTVGGVITSTIVEFINYPAIYMIWRGRGLVKD
jgi:Cu(I)/Ag(I) efflux system membrane protein CusA/SilA